MALWNGRDDHLKERLFGLSGPEGNHGEDAKEEWWYLDATPTHSWGQQAYAYPQQAFPYDRLIHENGERTFADPEFELRDTGIFDHGWWDVRVDHAKAAPDDMCLRVTATNNGPTRDTIHVIPTMWFRNRWQWGYDDAPVPCIRLSDHGGFAVDEGLTGHLELTATPGSTPLFCDNETNSAVLWDKPNRSQFTTDGIGERIVNGNIAAVDDSNTGTKGALWYTFDLDVGESAEVIVRLAPEARPVGRDSIDVLDERKADADEFYDPLLSSIDDPDRTQVARQAFAGLLHSKQWYHFDVNRWLDGDPNFPPPPESRLVGRNALWRHLNNADVIAMPDTWEYPWYAAWDTAFQCLPLALVDSEFAKSQLLLLGREWYQHPNGQLPAYEWSFDDVNPPVHAWAALRVFELAGASDFDFLERMLHKLLLNFTWWVNRRDVNGNNMFDGGFLGLDNIGPFDRSNMQSNGGALEQSDATAWMGMYSLDMLDMALRVAAKRKPYEDIASKFAEHFALISTAMNEEELWHDDAGFYYDVLRTEDDVIPVEVRSMVGLIPIFATRVISRRVLDELPEFAERLEWFRSNKPELAQNMHENEAGDLLMSLVSPERLTRLLSRVLDHEEFLSPYGVRALSKYHGEHPASITIGDRVFSVGYEPGESQSDLFGGNSNWRGPVWFPVNYLLIESLRRFDYWAAGSVRVECPTGSGADMSLGQVANELSLRLSALFAVDPLTGTRPGVVADELYAQGGPWHDRLLFHEYFHGDTGQGLGASHQTGWTALVAMLLTDSAVPFGRRRYVRHD